MKARVQRFNVGDDATILGGLRLKIVEVFLDPHPAGYEHCAGNSARYTCSSEFGPQTRYDWELEPLQKLVRENDKV